MEFSSTYQSSDVRCDDLFFILLGHICQIQAKIEHGPSIENKHWAFQYGPVIKLTLQILPSIHGQPYGIDHSLIAAYNGHHGEKCFPSYVFIR